MYALIHDIWSNKQIKLLYETYLCLIRACHLGKIPYAGPDSGNVVQHGSVVLDLLVERLLVIVVVVQIALLHQNLSGCFQSLPLELGPGQKVHR